MILDGEITKIKVVDIKSSYNFVVEKFFHLKPCMPMMNFSHLKFKYFKQLWKEKRPKPRL